MINKIAVRLGELSPGAQYAIAAAVEGVLFLVAWFIVGESELLFTQIFVVSAVLLALFLQRGPASLAALLAAASVDFHYIRPQGALMQSREGIEFLLFTLVLVEGAVLLASRYRDARLGAEAATATREQVLGVVAHDLRQPMATVAMQAALLRRLMQKHSLPVSADLDMCLNLLQQQVARSNRMIGDLLDFARIDSGQLRVEQGEVDLRRVIETSAQMVGGHYENRPIVITAEPELKAQGDPMRVTQVLDNLLMNAMKYGRPGTPVGVRVTEHDHEVQVTVSNEGPGIQGADLAKIFRRFERAGDPQRRKVGGLGLGLYVARGIVESLGGRIWAESEPEQVTRFHFTLKKKPAQAPTAVTASRSA